MPVAKRGQCKELPVLQVELEAAIPEASKFWCPHPDCSALMVLDTSGPMQQEQCPSCHRALCAWCRSPWHTGLTCGENKVRPHLTVVLVQLELINTLVVCLRPWPCCEEDE